jgi:molybdate transport system ATP-binding protein
VLSVEVAKRLPDFTLELAFQVRDEILVLFGPSGSGKSMTLRMIAGLERPDRGEIRLDDTLLFSSARRIHLPPQRRRCGYVFQNLALFPHLDVTRNVGYGTPRGRADTRQRLDRLLDTFGIGHLRHRYPAELSGGEQQRVALARALMTRPAVLLLDEPFNALDQDTRAAVYRELLHARRLWRIPFVLVTHDRAEAERLADRVLFLREGREERG